MKALVIGRRRKGRHIGPAVREVREALGAAGWSVDSAVVKRRSELRRRAAQAVRDGCDVAVAVGGDGAVHEVATALAGSHAALGIIPMGTGNLLAGNLGIPSRVGDAAQTIIAGSHKRIDVGRATIGGKRYIFAVACGIGFDADVMNGTRSEAKRRWGKAAYFASAISARDSVANVPHELRLDGVVRRTKAAEVMVANFGRMTAGVSPRRAVLPDDGLLDVIVLSASGPIQAFAATLAALWQADLGESAGGRVFRTQARKVRVATARPRRVEVDGSVVGQTPVRISIQPAALTVIVPATKSS